MNTLRQADSGLALPWLNRVKSRSYRVHRIWACIRNGGPCNTVTPPLAFGQALLAMAGWNTSCISHLIIFARGDASYRSNLLSIRHKNAAGTCCKENECAQYSSPHRSEFYRRHRLPALPTTCGGKGSIDEAAKPPFAGSVWICRNENMAPVALAAGSCRLRGNWRRQSVVTDDGAGFGQKRVYS